ncbi:hypothetical protein [Mycoplasmopsis gallinacea]|uniref:C-5 cytosine-specific DNA methylase n=1 Tax=Mycoplasmopsis gallinacea TaxID=29556 RepID=A0A6H0V1Z0_9BACT|nr:hypothetical protein [Mycoplasmopsis gallinacea]QIW62351.1 hypothetical protein GOQ20_02865 [Mycoplasmopsis gallinacea]
MKQKLIVWDLFGGGNNSVYKSLIDSDKYEIHTIDITVPERKTQYDVDLSQDFKVLKKFFDKLPQPDIIVASPLCQSFSSVLSMKGGGTCFWKYKDSSKTCLTERTKEEFEQLKSGFTRYLKADNQLFIKRLGEKCIDNTLSIIKHYKPKYFYIENPHNSLMWKYIKYNTDFGNYFDLHFNKGRYGNYGFIIRKDTIFLSNVEMKLKWEKFIPPYYTEIVNGEIYTVMKDNPQKRVKGIRAFDFSKIGIKKSKAFSTRQISEIGEHSNIPKQLIREIFNYFI